MWRQPDSAFAVLRQFAASPQADSLDEFNGHYCQLLVAELLFKNYKQQSNRHDLLRAVEFFDSLTANTHGMSSQERNTFLDARVHYINGVGLYENDSVVEAMDEYLNVLRIMEMYSLKPPHTRFMMTIHCRIGDLLSSQYMQEPAIVCYENAMKFIGQRKDMPLDYSGLLQKIGFQYDKLQQYDNARYYYNESLRHLPDTNNWLYKNLLLYNAMLDCASGDDFENSILKLKQLVSQLPEYQRYQRYINIGIFYQDAAQNDSALIYLRKAFVQSTNAEMKSYVAEFIHDIYQSEGDTLNASKYETFLFANPSNERVSMARVSTLNDMFQNYLRNIQEKKQQQMRKKIVFSISIATAMILLVAIIVAKTIIERNIAENIRLQKEKQCLQKDFDENKRQQFELLQKHAKAIFNGKKNKSLPLIIDEFNSIYPNFFKTIQEKHPNINETEKNILVLSLLNFRIKEEAEILNLSENTVMKYRSNLKKKVSFDQNSI